MPDRVPALRLMQIARGILVLAIGAACYRAGFSAYYSVCAVALGEE